jgi:hypothetical protein
VVDDGGAQTVGKLEHQFVHVERVDERAEELERGEDADGERELVVGSERGKRDAHGSAADADDVQGEGWRGESGTTKV